MNTLQSLHGHLSGFHFLIFWRKIGSVAQSLMLEGSKFQILGPRYDNVAVPYNTVFTLYERKVFVSKTVEVLDEIKNLSSWY